MVAARQSAVARTRQQGGTLAGPMAGILGPLPGRARVAARDRLALAIEAEVVPRLLLTHAAPPGLPDLGLVHGLGPTEADIAHLGGLLLVDDSVAAFTFVDGLCRQGMPLDRIFLDLLGPVARRLGQCWLDDLCDFGTVTLGLLRLQHMLRDHAPVFETTERRRDPRRRILVTSPQGEGHGFGRDMMVRFFRRAGWDTCDLPQQPQRDLAALVRREWFAVIGFSVASTSRLDAAAGAIRAVRRASRNGQIGVMVGGPIFVEHPELVTLVGADATATDAQQATLQAERLLGLLAHRE